MLKKVLWAATLVAFLFSMAALGEDARAAQEPEVINLQTLIVTGAQPGPAVLRFAKESKTILLFPLVESLPREVTWIGDSVEASIASSDVVLGPSGIRVGADAGLFGGLAMMRQASRMGVNPKGTTLSGRLNQEQLRKWHAARETILKGRDFEKFRPSEAAKRLASAFHESQGLEESTIYNDGILAMAKRHGKPVHSGALQISIPQPRKFLLEYNSTNLDDVQCLMQTIEAVEKGRDLTLARANAWSIGDMDALLAMPSIGYKRTCAKSMASSVAAKKLGISRLDDAVVNAWLAQLEASLGKNNNVFAVVPVDLAFGTDSIVVKLEARGFRRQ